LLNAYCTVGVEIAKMVEFGLGPKAKQANLDGRLTRSVKLVAGARNRLNLQLRELLKTAVVCEEATSGMPTSVPRSKLPSHWRAEDGRS
jgi:hypothetical protein